MKKSIVALVLVAVAAAILVLFLLNKQQTGAPQLSQIAPAGSGESQRGAPGNSSSPDTASQLQAKSSDQSLAPESAPTNTAALLALEQARAQAVNVRVGQVLATVNGVAITLRDLMPIDPSDTDSQHSMSRPSYEQLLERAIQRELVMQAAQRQGIALTGSQQDQLARIEQTMRGRDGANPDVVLARPNVHASLQSQIDFQLRDATGLILQQTLADRSGAPPPYVTPDQVQQYYQKNIDRYGALPSQPQERETAWRQIDAQIRRELTFSTLEQHAAQLKAYMDQLKAAADVKVVPAAAQ